MITQRVVLMHAESAAGMVRTMGQESRNIHTQQMSPYAISTSVQLRVPAEEAFAAFTDRLGDWWVREYTWSGRQLLVALGVEPRADGMFYEIGPHGFRMDWGRVLDWEPPYRLRFTWQIGPDRTPVPDPGRASEVEVHFHPVQGHTEVRVEHRHFDRHGTAAQEYRAALTAGWEELLSRYAEVATRPTTHHG